MTPGARSHLIYHASGRCTLFEVLSAPDHAMQRPLAGLALGRLAVAVRCEEVEMYCSHCHRPVLYNNPEKQGWCEKCKRVVKVSPCSMSPWCVLAGLLLPWLMSV
jgi:hypothetical protein